MKDKRDIFKKLIKEIIKETSYQFQIQFLPPSFFIVQKEKGWLAAMPI
jgi:hypothetical protein